MLNALASGTLVRDPKSGTSASGTQWANTTIRCNVGQDKDGAAQTAFITVVCFNEQAAKLARLAKGDAISVQGSLKPTVYEKDGETRHGLEIVAQGILSPYDLRKRRGDTGSHQGKPRPIQGDYGGRDFDDPARF